MANAAILDGTETGTTRAGVAQVERAALAVLAARVGAAGCGYVAQVLMARLMGGVEYGVFAAVWVWIAILGHASTWGFAGAASRFVPEGRARGELDAVRGFLAAGVLVALCGGALVALAGAAFALARPDALGQDLLAPLLIAGLIVPVFALQDFAEGTARAFGWPLLAVAPPYLVRQALIMGAMSLAVLAGAPAEAWVAVASTLLATALALAFQAMVLLRRLAAVLPAGPRRMRWRAWRRTALPVALVDLAGSGLNFVDVLVLGLVMPPAAVGVYFAATRLQQLVVFVGFAASAATAPLFAAAWASGDRAGLQRLVARRARLATLASLGAGGLVFAASPLLLGLFGPEFRAAVPVVGILVAGVVAQSALGPADDLLTVLGGERLCAGVSCGAVALAALLVLALAPVLGVEGAALGMALAGTARAAALAAFARSRLGVATPVFAGRRPAA